MNYNLLVVGEMVKTAYDTRMKCWYALKRDEHGKAEQGWGYIKMPDHPGHAGFLTEDEATAFAQGYLSAYRDFNNQ